MDLLTRHGLAAYERQLALGEHVGDLPWVLDQEGGRLRLGEDQDFPAQFAGSESEQTHTWLWAWANPSVDEKLAQRVMGARTLGEQQGIAALTEAQLDLDRVGNAHFLVMATSGALGSDPYYRCPYEGGAAFVWIAVPDSMRPQGDITWRATQFLPAAVTDLPMLNSRHAIKAYLSDIGGSMSEGSTGIQLIDGPLLEFDQVGRFVGIG